MNTKQLLGKCPDCGNHSLLCNNWEMLSRPGMTSILCASCGYNGAIEVIQAPNRTLKMLPIPGRYKAQRLHAEYVSPASEDAAQNLPNVAKQSRRHGSDIVIRMDTQEGHQRVCSGKDSFGVVRIILEND